MAIQTSSTEVSIRAMAEWKENPKYRGNDYIGTYIQDDDVYFEDGEKKFAKYYYCQNSIKDENGMSELHQVENTNVIANSKLNAIGAHIRLKEDTIKSEYSNHRIIIGGHFFVNDYMKKGKVLVRMQYIHQERRAAGIVNAGLSFDANGKIVPNVSYSGNISDCFTRIAVADMVNVLLAFDNSTYLK